MSAGEAIDPLPHGDLWTCTDAALFFPHPLTLHPPAGAPARGLTSDTGPPHAQPLGDLGPVEDTVSRMVSSFDFSTPHGYSSFEEEP